MTIDDAVIVLVRAALIEMRREIVWLLAREHGVGASQMERYFREYPDARLPEIVLADAALEKLRCESVEPTGIEVIAQAGA
jgi:hypothetical protein